MQRVIALLSLFFGFIGIMLLDGQVFTHAVMGVVFGVAAIWGGLGSAQKDFANEERRWLGRIMAALGLALVVFCVIQLPSSYQRQERFNARSKKHLEANPVNQTTNTPIITTNQANMQP